MRQSHPVPLNNVVRKTMRNRRATLRRSLAVVTLVGAAACTLASCSSSGSSDDAQGPIELKFWSNLTVDAQASVMQS